MNAGLVYNIVLGISLFVAVVFTFAVLLTSKGDAMSGGSSSVRTTFKGKASLDDLISRVLMVMGAVFIVLMLLLNRLSNVALH